MRRLAIAVALFGCDGDGPHTDVPGGDPYWGTEGLATVSFEGGLAGVMKVAVAPDGKIYAAGGTNESFFVSRLKADRTVDESFGKNGVVQEPWGVTTNGVQPGYGLAIQSDGKIVVGARILAGYGDLAGRAAIARYNPDGTADTSFNGTGYIVEKNAAATAIGIQSDGHIVVGGFGKVVRYNADGSPDAAFGTMMGGAPINMQALDIAIGSGDSIVVCGGDAIAKLTPTGMPDTSFATTGSLKASAMAPATGGAIYDCAIQGDKILVAGGFNISRQGSTDFGVARLSANGALDTTWGTAGFATDQNTDPSTSSASTQALGVAALPSGKVVASGFAYFGTMYGRAVTFDATGHLDSGGLVDVGGPGSSMFSNVEAIDGGAVVGGAALASRSFVPIVNIIAAESASITLPVGSGFDRAHEVVELADGNVLVAGWSLMGGPSIARLTNKGVLDETYGMGGRAVSFSTRLSYVSSLLAEDDGSFVAGGLSTSGFILAKFTPQGMLDETWATEGVARVEMIGAQSAYGFRAAKAPSGKYVVAGQVGSGAEGDIGVARFTDAGALDTSFGSGGTATSTLTGAGSVGAYVIVQPDEKIVVLGIVQGGNGLVRFTDTGALDTSFGTGGKAAIATPGASAVVQPAGLAMAADGTIVALLNDLQTGTLTLAKFDANGQPGPTGTIVVGGNDYIQTAPMGLVVRDDGGLLVGSAGTQDNLVEHGVVLHVAPDLTVEDMASLELSRGSTSLHGMSLDKKGRLYIAGRTWTETGGSDFAILRMNP